MTAQAGTLEAAGPDIDPIQLEIIKGCLVHAQRESETILQRTAMSPVIREKYDFFIGFHDAKGRLIVGTDLPLFGKILEPVFELYPPETMQPGDIYLYNDCYGTGGSVSHTPDLVFSTPAFHEGELVGFVHSWAHFIDIGGSVVGTTSPSAIDVMAEGTVIPPVLLARGGKFIDEIFRILLRNTRFPKMVRGDVRAMIASVNLGAARIGEAFERFGPRTLTSAFRQLQNQTQTAIRNTIRREYKEGQYEFCDSIDDDGYGAGPFTIRMGMTVKDGTISLDATATDAQAKGPVNFIMQDSMPKLVFAMLMTEKNPGMLLNHGAIDAAGEVAIKAGTLVQPNFPAPIGQRMITLIRVMSTCAGLHAQACGGQSNASNSAYTVYFLRGFNPKENEIFWESSGMGVGYGARPYADGHSATYFGPVKNYPVEFLEKTYPIRVWTYGIHCDTGGPGRWRGGCGIVREFEVLVDGCEIGLRMDNVENPPWGVNGGKSGRGGRFVFNPGTPQERELKRLSEGTKLNKGDVIRIETPGGGGWGHPFDREPERVLDDVLCGFVSPEKALEDYGVVLTDSLDALDLAATQAHRQANRFETKLFHRKGYYEPGEWFERHRKKIGSNR